MENDLIPIFFYRGEKSLYDASYYKNGIYWCTDTLEILHNGKSYGGGLTNVEFSNGTLKFYLSNGQCIEAPINEATNVLSGLMSPEDKQKLDGLPSGDELGQSIEQLDYKVGTNNYNNSNYLTQETNLTDAVNELDSQLKSTNDSLDNLDSQAIKHIYVNNVGLSTVDNTVNIPLVSTSSDGAMSKEDKSKINKIIDTGTGNQYLANDGTYKTLTKDTVGLGNVDNTSDINKPISTAQREALDQLGTSIQDHINDKSNPHNTTKSQVGLSNVDNTSDIDKPVSNAQSQAILQAKQEIEQNLEDHINDKNNPHQVTKNQIGLGNVDNTSDLNKPISTSVQKALDELISSMEAITIEEIDEICV